MPPSFNPYPLFDSVPRDGSPENAHLKIVPDAIVEQLNSRALTFVANSVELFGRAWAEYMKQGRGALFVRYDSLEDMEECAAKNQYKMRYAELTELLAINYPPGHKLVKDYNAQTEFVLVVGVSCTESLGGMVFASSLVPRNAQFHLNDAACALEAYQQRGGRDVTLPPRDRAAPLRMCCTLRAALSMSQCDHDE
jgi:hypothetical protein